MLRHLNLNLKAMADPTSEREGGFNKRLLNALLPFFHGPRVVLRTQGNFKNACCMTSDVRQKWSIQVKRGEKVRGRGEEKEKRKLTGQIMWRLRGHYDWLFVRLK